MATQEEFIAAVKGGEADRVETMLGEEPSLADASSGGVSAVLLAAYFGKGDIARAIARRRDALTLHEACAIGDSAAVDRALERDAALLNAPGSDGHYPVGLAIFFGHPELARTLIERGADITLHSKNGQQVAPVHAAAAVRDSATMRLLLERGADPNARQESDYRPMHTAASRGDLEMAKLLLEFGAERNPAGRDGKTPGDVAREHGQNAFAEWIENSAR